MNPIRKATSADISRIAEILVFTKRVNYRSIFKDDYSSFNDLQVLSVAHTYETDPVLLPQTWVYDDGIVKGLIEIRENEIETLYVDHFFQNEGIGGKLIDFAVKPLMLTTHGFWRKTTAFFPFMPAMVFNTTAHESPKPVQASSSSWLNADKEKPPRMRWFFFM